MGKKSGFVSIIGKPNAGKSTLLNSVLGSEISIVTAKPQTTRNRIYGIYNDSDLQVVFVDTPGILRPQYEMQVLMEREIESSFLDADAIVLVYDVSEYDKERLSELTSQFAKDFSSHKVLIVLNKIDLITKEELLPIVQEISGNFKFEDIIPLSASRKYNVDEFIKTIVKYIPEGEYYYDSEIVAAQPERFFAAEIIRKQALRMYRKEIPFSIFVEIEEFKVRGSGKDFIRANIIVERDSQKGIVIGSGGNMLKKLGELSRKEIEIFTGRGVYLELFVKVKKNWKNDEHFLKNNFTKHGAPAN